MHQVRTGSRGASDDIILFWTFNDVSIHQERGSAEAQKWKSLAEKHSDDLNRVRATRDQHYIEIGDLKRKLSSRRSAYDEQQTLLQSRTVCLFPICRTLLS